MRRITDAEAWDALAPAYAAALIDTHVAHDIDGGPTCDEQGCLICNAGGEAIEQIVAQMQEDRGIEPDLDEMIAQIEDWLEEVKAR